MMSCARTSAAKRQGVPRGRRRARAAFQVAAKGDETPSTSSSTPTPPPPASSSLPSTPTDAVVYGGTLPPTRRLVLGTTLATFFAVGGNFGGVTSALLGSTDGLERLGRSLRLDAVVPISAYKRHYVLNASASPVGGYSTGFEFVYPATWLADVTIAQRNARLQELSRSLDPVALRGEEALRRQRMLKSPLVAAAYGPRGTTGETNASVVKSPIDAGFDVRNLGTPEEAAKRFLSTVAPPGSGRIAYLASASSREGRDGSLFYTIEYVVQNTKLGWIRSNDSVYGQKDDIWYTFNAQAPMDGAAVPREDLKQVSPSPATTTTDDSDLAPTPQPPLLPPAPAMIAQFRVMADSFELTE